MIYKLTQTTEAKSVNFQSVNTCNRTSGNNGGTNGMVVPRDSCIMTTACGGLLMSDRAFGLGERAGVGGRPRNRGGKCSRAEPLRGGDAKLPAQTAFEQRVAGLPISEELIARSDTVYSVFDRAHQVSNDCRMESLEIENVVRAQH